MTTEKATAINYSAGIATALWGALTVEQLIGIAGLLIALAGLCVNIYFKNKEDKRQAELHLLKVKGEIPKDK